MRRRRWARAPFGVLAIALTACSPALARRVVDATVPFPAPIPANGPADTACVVWSSDPREQLAPPDARVRVSFASGGDVPVLLVAEGVVVTHTADSIAILTVDSTVVRFPAARIVSVERLVLNRLDNAIVSGAALGLLPGLVIGYYAGLHGADQYGEVAGVRVFAYAMGGMLGGAAVGGVIGGVARGHSWRTVWGEEANVRMRALRRSRGMCAAWPRR